MVAWATSCVSMARGALRRLALEIPCWGGRETGYERLKGKKYTQETVEVGEKVHYRYNKKSRPRDEELEVH